MCENVWKYVEMYISIALHMVNTWFTPDLHLIYTWFTPNLHLIHTYAQPILSMLVHFVDVSSYFYVCAYYLEE